jgi:hypothetical protein
LIAFAGEDRDRSESTSLEEPRTGDVVEAGDVGSTRGEHHHLLARGSLFALGALLVKQAEVIVHDSLRELVGRCGVYAPVLGVGGYRGFGVAEAEVGQGSAFPGLGLSLDTMTWFVSGSRSYVQRGAPP